MEVGTTMEETAAVEICVSVVRGTSHPGATKLLRTHLISGRATIWHRSPTCGSLNAWDITFFRPRHLIHLAQRGGMPVATHTSHQNNLHKTAPQPLLVPRTNSPLRFYEPQTPSWHTRRIASRSLAVSADRNR